MHFDSDVRTFRRIVGVASLILAPLVALAAFAVTPVSDAEWPTTRILAETAEHPGAFRLANWLGVALAFLLVPAILSAMRVAMRGAPWLATFAGGLALAGWLGVFTLNALDALTFELARSSLDPSSAATIYDSVDGNGVILVTVVIFVAGHILGTIGLAVALLRARAVGSWAATAIAIATPVHLVAHFAGSRALDLGGWSLLGLGFAAVAVVGLRMPNEDWDVRPAVGARARQRLPVEEHAAASAQ